MFGRYHYFLVLLYQQLGHFDLFGSGLIICLIETLELLDDVEVRTFDVAIEVDYLLLIMVKGVIVRFDVL